MIKLTATAMGIWIVLIGVLVMGRITAQQTTIPDVVKLHLPDSSCQAPCWQGINTDEADHAETVDAILQLPHAQQIGLLDYSFRTDSDIGDNLVRLDGGRDLIFTPYDLRLGHLIAELDAPQAQLRGTYYDANVGHGSTFVMLYHEQYALLTIILLDDENAALRPDQPIYQLIYPTAAYPMADFSVVTSGWEGFTFPLESEWALRTLYIEGR